MMESVAAKVARFAQIPVLVLREGGSVPKERHPGEQPLLVLVLLDGSDYAKAALGPAAYPTALENILLKMKHRDESNRERKEEEQ